MKTLKMAVVLLASTLMGWSAPGDMEETAYSVVERGAHHRVWEKTVYEPGLSAGGSKPATCGQFKTSQSEAGDS